jgi:hypothetical protein
MSALTHCPPLLTLGEACLYQLTLFHVQVHCKYTTDQARMTWRHNSILKHISSCLKSALENQSTDEVYCSLKGLLALGGGSIPTEIMTQAQRPGLVILDRPYHDRHRISLVELTCTWDVAAEKAKDCKASKYIALCRACFNERNQFKPF